MAVWKTTIIVASEMADEPEAPDAIRELVDRLIELGVIDEPDGGGYTIEWPALSDSRDEN